LVEGTVHVARRHALELIELEQRLGIFYEVEIQKWFLQYPLLMTMINNIYSFVHIPATILFLVVLFWYTKIRSTARRNSLGELLTDTAVTPKQDEVYEQRRRTMAFCNLLAFIVFTIWPCMPPRLLSDKSVEGPSGYVARQYGFVDTVHSKGGQASVWTQNKFCNQYAAMPSLHFGYSLLIGLTIMTIPLYGLNSEKQKINIRGSTFHVNIPSKQRLACLALGFAYPLIILIAIVATANHFILDAVAGAMVCGIAWSCNHLMLNFLPLRDWMFWCMRLHIPVDIDPREAVDSMNEVVHNAKDMMDEFMSLKRSE
jgi:hypothetical protein